MGTEATIGIVKAREEKGAFKDLFDFCNKVNMSQLNKKTIESLVMAGAFDSLSPDKKPEINRPSLLADVEPTIEKVNKLNEPKQDLTLNLFGEEEIYSTAEVKPIERWTNAQMLNNERDVLGVYFSGHPLAKYTRHLNKVLKDSVTKINEHPANGSVIVAGVITRLKKRQTRDKKNWAQITLEDEKYSVTANIFAKVWEHLSDSLSVYQTLIVRGDIKGSDEAAGTEIIVSGVEPIFPLISRRAKKMYIHLPKNVKNEQLLKVKEMLGQNMGLSEVYLDFCEDGKKHLIRTPYKITIDIPLVKYLEDTFGTYCWDIDVK